MERLLLGKTLPIANETGQRLVGGIRPGFRVDNNKAGPAIIVSSDAANRHL
jgi:mRNA-degrading endonuclease toxin of MazEF toxin-antitoxin module